MEAASIAGEAKATLSTYSLGPCSFTACVPKNETLRPRKLNCQVDDQRNPGLLLGLPPPTDKDGLISQTRIAAFGAAKPLFPVYGGIENDTQRLDGGEDGIRTRGSVRHRFGLFARESRIS